MDNNRGLIPVVVDAKEIKNHVYLIRGQHVMLDSDLALLYNVETKNLNKAANRNAERFPDDFRFQLTKEEFENLRFQFGTSNENNNHGGRRYYPYAYTEQGISMLASVLHSETAVQVSINIMRAFVEMRRFIANNAILFEKINHLELQQLSYQKQTDEKFDKVFACIDQNREIKQKIFFDGQIYDAFSLLVLFVQKATKDLILIDGYVDINTLNILSKKNNGVNVKIYTQPSSRLTAADVANFNLQYPFLEVDYTQVFHDRFLIIDHNDVYHIGASLKDAGKKCFGISHWQDASIVSNLLHRLNGIV